MLSNNKEIKLKNNGFIENCIRITNENEIILKSEEQQVIGSVSKLAKNCAINYQDHIIVFKNGTEREYGCAICYRKFTTLAAIKVHMTYHGLECDKAIEELKNKFIC